MIEISLGKLVLLALIALIVLGPEKLPGAARTAGALLRRVRSGWDNVRSEVERELEIEEIKRTAREAAAHAEAAQKRFSDGVKQVSDIPGTLVAAVTAPVDKPASGQPHGDEAPSAALVSDEPQNSEPHSTQAELPLNDPADAPAREPHGRA